MVAKRGYRHHDQQLSFFALPQKKITPTERMWGLYWTSIMLARLRSRKEV